MGLGSSSEGATLLRKRSSSCELSLGSLGLFCLATLARRVAAPAEGGPSSTVATGGSRAVVALL